MLVGGHWQGWLLLTGSPWKPSSWLCIIPAVPHICYLHYSLRSKRFRSVSEQRKTEEWDSQFWPREKWNKSQKMKGGGGGEEGRKRLQTNPSILKTCVRQRTQHLIGSVRRTVLTCVDQRFVSYWEDGMVRDTQVNFQWLLFWSLQCKNIFFDLFWNERLFLRLNKGFRLFNLI